MELHWEESDTKGRVYVGEPDNAVAEMTFSKAGDSLLIVDHTFVDESLRGQGAGAKLLGRVVQVARERGVNIVPLCPYAKARFDKDPSIRDVLAG